MIEWMEGGFGEGITLEFLKAEDIKPESLVMNDYPEIQINAVYRSVSPDTTDRIHLNEKEYNEPKRLIIHTYRPIYVAKINKIYTSIFQLPAHERHEEGWKEVSHQPQHQGYRLCRGSAGLLGEEFEDETKKLLK